MDNEADESQVKSKELKIAPDKIADIKFNIERANEILRFYENRRKTFLEINLALLPAFNIVLGVFFNVFNVLGKISISFSICAYFILTIINIRYNLKEHKTEGIEPAICSYTRDFDFCQYETLDDYPFKIDYETQIKNLHKYQNNYDKIAKKTRCYTFNGLKWLLYFLIVSIIINTIGIWVAILCQIEL